MPLPPADLTALTRALTLAPDALTDDLLPAVRRAGLGGAVRARLPHGHPWRAALRADALALALRHQQIRSELRPLLTAWAEQGIPALLFKGFALSEFMYGTRGERFYGDVDLLLPPDPSVVQRAVQIAADLGWRNDGQHLTPAHWRHESAHLFSPAGAARVDVHRWLVSPLFVGRARAAHLTAGLWQRSRTVDWDGVRVLRPDPRDELLLTLMISRCWGGDLGGLKPADSLDLARLRQASGCTAAELDAHAFRLGARHTWRAFQVLCDPHHLEVRVEHTRPVLRRAAGADRVRVHPGPLNRFKRVAQVLPHLPAAFADALWAVWTVRRGGDPRTHLRRATPPGVPRPLGPPQQDPVLAARRVVTRLLHPRQYRNGVCVPLAYATYRGLRRAGHPAVFVSGVARSPGGPVGHAWVEDHLGPMDLYGQPFNRQTFRVLFQYPDAPRAAP
ncbi:nucleotidyltransferase family protein [Deinococcus taeanensis]|uniref:nucleotidyltransferase family protein n=1 Tax=Deinococcus taeanensis TaxID=2737050 RepID=UPI001CDCEC34|nr:nucleotidyltransferase family protein [Deinococcus taeanensis]UBV43189.1 nucleotidyltransferase family protein [Deinococcus taeanensis]